MTSYYSKEDIEKNTLINQIKYQDKEILELKTKNSILEQKNINLSSENAKLKNELVNCQIDGQNFPKIKKILEEKENELEKMTNLYENLQKEFRDYKIFVNNRYEKDITQVKLQNENNLFKVENANKIEKCNDTLYYKILELENIILKFSEEEKKKLNNLEVQHQNKMASFKKKMLDYLKNEHSNYGSSSNRQSELNSKLTILHVTELIKELEFQSNMIESLLREKEILKKKVFDMSNDIKIHVEVENCLEEKNKKFQKQLHSLSKPIKINKISYHSPVNSNLNSPQKLKFSNSRHFSTNSFSSNSKTSNLSSSSLIEASQKKILLTKELLSKEKEKENYRMKYDTAQSKLNYLDKKFGNIYKLFDTALDKIYNENLKEDVKDIFINLDDFKTCEFEKLTNEQQYGILALLIKYILPVVNQELTNNELLNKKLSKVRQKYYFNNSVNPANINYLLLSKNNPQVKNSGSNESYSTNLTSSDLANYKNGMGKKAETLGDFSYKIKKSKLKIEDTKLRLDTFSIFQN